jgi:hypothetical protein
MVLGLAIVLAGAEAAPASSSPPSRSRATCASRGPAAGARGGAHAAPRGTDEVVDRRDPRRSSRRGRPGELGPDLRLPGRVRRAPRHLRRRGHRRGPPAPRRRLGSRSTTTTTRSRSGPIGRAQSSSAGSVAACPCGCPTACTSRIEGVGRHERRGDVAPARGGVASVPTPTTAAASRCARTRSAGAGSDRGDPRALPPRPGHRRRAARGLLALTGARRGHDGRGKQR